MRIKDIPEENRPRERMFRNGVNVLSDAELKFYSKFNAIVGRIS